MNKPKFQTPYNYEPTKGQEFSKEENEYGYVEDENGQLQLQVIGKTNIYDKIQESKDETDINKILAKQGIKTLNELPQVELDSEITDISKMPKTLIEAHQQEKFLTRTLEQKELEIKKATDKAKKEALSNKNKKEQYKKLKDKWNKLTEAEQKEAISFNEWKENN